MRLNTCCFTGHRALPPSHIEGIIKRLSDEMDMLIRQGITNFISGGALGFDQMAASLVIARRENGANIRLIFALPCRGQEDGWPDERKRLYHALLREANEVRYISESCSAVSMKKRNRYMVDNSSFCICALFRQGRSGTAQTVRYALRQGVRVINVAKNAAAIDNDRLLLVE